MTSNEWPMPNDLRAPQDADEGVRDEVTPDDDHAGVIDTPTPEQGEQRVADDGERVLDGA